MWEIKLRRVIFLILSDNAITDDGLDHIKKMLGLNVLLLDGTEITDAVRRLVQDAVHAGQLEHHFHLGLHARNAEVSACLPGRLEAADQILHMLDRQGVALGRTVEPDDGHVAVDFELDVGVGGHGEPFAEWMDYCYKE